MEIVPRERRIEQLLVQRFEWTERQQQVLDLLARGKSNAEIAEALGISLDGAKWHMREILSKLGVNSREDAAEYWRRASSLRQRVRHGLDPRSLIRLPRAIPIAAATVATAAGLVALVWLSSRHGETIPGPSGHDAAAAVLADFSPTSQHTRAGLAGRVLEIAADHLIVDRGDGQFLVRWTADTMLQKPEGAPVYQLVRSRGLARLHAGDSVDIVGKWTGSTEFLADAVSANLWIHRPGVVAAMSDTTIDLRIPEGKGAPFPDQATTLHVDRTLVPWPSARLLVGERIEFEAAQADDGSLILVGLLASHPVKATSPP